MNSKPIPVVRLTGAQIRGFWAAWSGWVLDGMDSFIFALVLAPALSELLPKSGFDNSPGRVAFAGSVMFALFLMGWGTSFVWGPIADRFGRTRALAGSIAVYAAFTGAAAFSQSIWHLALFRFLAGVGIGGEWALAGTYVAESWPEERRKMGAGYLQTGYYVGFFIAAALNYSIGAAFGWRAMFLCGLAPVVVAVYVLSRIDESERWTRAALPSAASPLRLIFSGAYRRRTVVNTTLVTVSIVGLWAGAVYEPTAIVALARKAGHSMVEATRLASLGTGLLSIGTCIGCLAAPPLAERFGRRWTLGLYFVGMALVIWLAFGSAFYAENALVPFMSLLVALGMFGGNFAMYSLWLPEQYPTAMRATAFAFITSFGRFIGAGINFALGAAIQWYGSLGLPVAATAIAFILGLCVLPLAHETRGERLPD